MQAEETGDMGKSAAGLVAVLLVGAAFVATSRAGPAEDTTPPVIVSLDVRPELVALDGSNRVEVVLEAHVTDDVAVTVGKGFLIGPSFYGIPTEEEFALELVEGDAQDGIWRGTLVFTNRSAPAGKWTSEACFGDAAHPYYCQDSAPADVFHVKRSTTIRGFNIAEPVARGSQLRMHGRLLRLKRNGTFVAFGKKKVLVFFKPAGTGTWRFKGSVLTSADGSFANRQFKARRDGAWRVVSRPTEVYLGKTSGVDFVALR
jgi:hypothetical protein